MTEEKDQQEMGIGLVGCGFIGRSISLATSISFYYEPSPGRAVVRLFALLPRLRASGPWPRRGFPSIPWTTRNW